MERQQPVAQRFLLYVKALERLQFACAAARAFRLLARLCGLREQVFELLRGDLARLFQRFGERRLPDFSAFHREAFGERAEPHQLAADFAEFLCRALLAFAGRLAHLDPAEGIERSDKALRLRLGCDYAHLRHGFELKHFQQLPCGRDFRGHFPRDCRDLGLGFRALACRVLFRLREYRVAFLFHFGGLFIEHFFALACRLGFRVFQRLAGLGVRRFHDSLALGFRVRDYLARLGFRPVEFGYGSVDFSHEITPLQN